MANQSLKIVGNVGGKPIFKDGEFHLVEFNVLAEEFRQNHQSQQYEALAGSQNWYQVTVWGKSQALLADMKGLTAGMRVQIEGDFSAVPWIKEGANGEKTAEAGLRISTRPAGVSLKLNRVENIVMKAKQEQNSSAQAQNQG